MIATAHWIWAGLLVLLGAAVSYVVQASKALHDAEETHIQAWEAAIREQVAARPGHPIKVLITGANRCMLAAVRPHSGIGFSLATALAKLGVEVVLGCRNPQRAAAARDKILAQVPGAALHFLQVDVSSPTSVHSAAQKFIAEHQYLDALYLNAGIMPVKRHNWPVLVQAFATGAVPLFFETGRATLAGPHFLLCPAWCHNFDASGAPLMLATHVLGHAMLVEELADALRAGQLMPGDQGGRVVWTSSRAASAPQTQWPAVTKPEDHPLDASGEAPVQHMESYGEAKYITDLLSVHLNKAVQSKGIAACSVVMCPGAVDTEIIPPIFKPFQGLLAQARAWLPGFNVDPRRGNAAHLAMSVMPAESLQSNIKYVLCADGVCPATAGSWPRDEQSVAQARQVVADWLAYWRQRHRLPAPKHSLFQV